MNNLIKRLIYEMIAEDQQIPSGYLTKDAAAMGKEIKKHADKDDNDPTAYNSHPKGGWKADYNKSGERYKTKKSKWTSAYHKRFGESEEIDESLFLEHLMADDNLEEEAIVEDITGKIEKALKNKADASNAPLGALTAVYRKGLAAWKTGHRPGVSQHQWAMGRVNSFLAGGPARKVDAAQWEKVKNHRKDK